MTINSENVFGIILTLCTIAFLIIAMYDTIKDFFTRYCKN